MRLLIYSMCFLLSSCAGYHFVKSDNPLEKFNIKSISVPMFVNHTVLPSVSGPMTREIVKVLKEYPGIEVFAGENFKADAILVGTLSSVRQVPSFYQTTATKFTTGGLKDSIGTRKEFYVPSTTAYGIVLNLVLIKDPTPTDLKILESDLGQYINRHPRVIFSESINLTGSFTRSARSNLSPDDGGVVNYTNNQGLLKKNIESLAESAAVTFKEVIINAF